MNIESLGRRAISQLREFDNFPSEGFIAGGCIANLIWEYVSGTKAIINDIDLFIFDKIIDKLDIMDVVGERSKRLFYHEKEIKYFEDYTGLCTTTKSKEYYLIEKTSHEGLYNTIHYSSNSESPQVIVNSFDINCTQVGYSINEDKFYWSKDFEIFLETGNLQLVNLMSPAHTAMRLVKKKHDLNANLNSLELKMCHFSLIRGLNDINRKFFTEKYAEIYRKYQSELIEYFNLRKSDDITLFFKNQKNLDLDIYSLELNKISQDLNDNRTSLINSGKELIFYLRNIRGNSSNQEIWDKLHYLFEQENYNDGNFQKEDIDMLGRLLQVAPNAIDNLRGLKLSEQISIMKTLFDKYQEDPIIAVSILEKIKITPDIKFDEGDILLLELSVRKEILKNSDKAKRIMHSGYISSSLISDDELNALF